ncbi:hypothetical protein EBS80_01755 [bacterium]|nr:hypothetical protein [bacterium]
MTQIELHQPIDWPRLNEKLGQYFHVGTVRGVSLVHGGYMSQNFRVETDAGTYFLKQYRNRMSAGVYEVKDSEEFFALNGLPVILSVRDAFGRDAFWIDGNWYSLFPFVDGHCPSFGTLRTRTFSSLGRMLARFHVAGRAPQGSYHRQLGAWDRRGFRLEFVELEQELLSRATLTDAERRMLDVLRFKARLVERNETALGDFRLPFDVLLHGDFVYQNVFVDREGEVTRVFDFEKTCMGPAAYELARSVFLNCFEDGLDDRNVERGRAFLIAYRSVRPVSFEEFLEGVRMYAISLFHMTWIEARSILYRNDESMPIYERHAKRVEMLSGDVRPLCERLYA